MTEPWDGGWGIGSDVTAAFARKALDAAGITREQACDMTLAELKKVPGMDLAGVDRLWVHGIHSDKNGRYRPATEAQRRAADLSDDEYVLLAILAAAEEPMVQSAVTDQILPPFPTGWVRKAGKQAWLARWDAVMAAWAQLERHGLLECMAADSARYVVTAAGREALDGMKEKA